MEKIDMVYKVNAVLNIINSNFKLIDKVYIFKKNLKTETLVKCCQKKNIKTFYIKKIVQKNLLYIKRTHQIIAIIKKQKKININKIIDLKKNVKILILDRIQDPYNLASCIRTAEAFTIDIVVISKKYAAGLSSLINSLSNGASILTPILIENRLINIVEILKKKNVKIIALSVKGSEEIKENLMKPPIAIIMGSEKNGISDNLKSMCDKIFKIKIENEPKSVNVSVATGIALSKISF